MRPEYHYAPAANWLSDPNGLIHVDGEWHLFYQYNPQGEDWGHMSWGHAVSPDLTRWTELSPALIEDDRHMIYSGSAVIDRNDTAGFGPDTMVAIYTGARQGEAHNQSQCLAFSHDRGRRWTKFMGNPVLDRGMADFRDPNVFWHAESRRWIMVVVLSNENRALIYRSVDLKQWEEVSEIAGRAAPGEIWECPLLIELPIEGETSRRWLFKVDVLRGAPGSGALYQTGTFDGLCFTPDAGWFLADWGSDFYAAIAWHDPRDAQGRPLWIGWLGNHAYQGHLPKQGWRGAMSVPRWIGLRRIDGALRLTQEVDACAVSHVRKMPLASGSIPAACYLEIDENSDFALTIDDSSGRQLSIERQGKGLRVSRLDAITPELDVVRVFDLIDRRRIAIWLDHGSVEVLAGGGAISVTLQQRMTGEHWIAVFNEAPMRD